MSKIHDITHKKVHKFNVYVVVEQLKQKKKKKKNWPSVPMQMLN